MKERLKTPSCVGCIYSKEYPEYPGCNAPYNWAWKYYPKCYTKVV